jgi:methylmalonyl-CoA mutase C-terminal domain/subunit
MDDVEQLEARGIARLFGPGTATTDIIDYIRAWAEKRGE